MSAHAWWRRRNKAAWRAKHVARVCNIDVKDLGDERPDWREALLVALGQMNGITEPSSGARYRDEQGNDRGPCFTITYKDTGEPF